MLTNCPNCGAPLLKDGWCEYCKTKVRLANLMEIDTDVMHYEPVEILLKFKRSDGTTHFIPFRGMLTDVNIGYSSSTIYFGNKASIVGNDPEITLTMNGHLCKLPEAEKKEIANEERTCK